MYQVTKNAYVRLYGSGKCVRHRSLHLKPITNDHETEPEVEIHLPKQETNTQELKKISQHPENVDQLVSKLSRLRIKANVKKIPKKKIDLDV